MREGDEEGTHRGNLYVVSNVLILETVASLFSNLNLRFMHLSEYKHIS